MLHGNPLRKALVLPQFANKNVEVLHESYNLPNSHDYSGTVLEYEPGFLCPSPLPSWCLAGAKEKYQGGARVCTPPAPRDSNKQQKKRLGWIVVVLCEIKDRFLKYCTAACLFKWVT